MSKNATTSLNTGIGAEECPQSPPWLLNGFPPESSLLVYQLRHFQELQKELPGSLLFDLASTHECTTLLSVEPWDVRLR